MSQMDDLLDLDSDSDSDLDEPERPPPAPELALLEKRYNLALARRFPDANVTVRLYEKNGEVLMDIEGVPLDEVHLLAEVLTRPMPALPDALGPQLPLPIRPS